MKFQRIPNFFDRQPLFFDQFYGGERVAALGVGAAPVPFKQLSAARLAKAITALTQDQSMRQRAAALSQKIRAEDGLGTAVALIDQFKL